VRTGQQARKSAPTDDSAASKNRPMGNGHVLVIGVPRAGATWVGETLSFANNTCLVNEPDNETSNPFAVRAKLPLGRYPVLGDHEQAPDDYTKLWIQAFSGRRSRQRSPRAAVARLLMRRLDGMELWNAFCKVEQPGATLRLRAVRALAQPDPLPRRTPRHVIVKSAHGPLAVEWIAARFRPLVVVVVRHPLNIVASWMELGWGGCSLDTNPKIIERYMRRWDLPALPPTCSRLSRVSWEVGLLLSVLRSSAEAHPEWRLVSHERLCSDPAGQFRELYTALGLDWTDEADLHLRRSNRAGTGLNTMRVAADQPDRWRKRLTGDQVREISGVLASFPVVARPL
jgi:hypothetical protein